MASLVEELVNILEAEQKVYETLTGYEEKKKDVLIRADVPALEEITNLEQLAGDELIAYSNKQVQALTDIGTGKDRGKDDSYETDQSSGYPAGDTEETDHCKR